MKCSRCDTEFNEKKFRLTGFITCPNCAARFTPYRKVVKKGKDWLFGLPILFSIFATHPFKIYLNNFFSSWLTEVIAGGVVAALFLIVFPFRSKYGKVNYKCIPKSEPSFLEKQDGVIVGWILVVTLVVGIILWNI